MIINISIDTEKDTEILGVLNALVTNAFPAVSQQLKGEEAPTNTVKVKRAKAAKKATQKEEPVVEAKAEPEPEVTVSTDEVDVPDKEVKATVDPQISVDELRAKCAGKVKELAQAQRREDIVRIFKSLGIEKVSTATDAQIVSLADVLEISNE